MFGSNAANISLDPRIGGRFCEKTREGSVRHMQAVFAKPPELLRLDGLPAALPPETFRAGPPGAVFTHNCRRSARLHDPGTAP